MLPCAVQLGISHSVHLPLDELPSAGWGNIGSSKLAFEAVGPLILICTLLGTP